MVYLLNRPPILEKCLTHSVPLVLNISEDGVERTIRLTQM